MAPTAAQFLCATTWLVLTGRAAAAMRALLAGRAATETNPIHRSAGEGKGELTGTMEEEPRRRRGVAAVAGAGAAPVGGGDARQRHLDGVVAGALLGSAASAGPGLGRGRRRRRRYGTRSTVHVHVHGKVKCALKAISSRRLRSWIRVEKYSYTHLNIYVCTYFFNMSLRKNNKIIQYKKILRLHANPRENGEIKR
jgi:hypothetical protein